METYKPGYSKLVTFLLILLGMFMTPFALFLGILIGPLWMLLWFYICLRIYRGHGPVVVRE